MKLKRQLLSVLGLSLLGASAMAANQDPIVLVHGFGGWDRNELLGQYYYWGGSTDLQAELNKLGHATVTAAVGPVSSNWDRAVELYFQLKGGCVDYGAAHAARHGHARMGRCFGSGRLPLWDASHKAHLIGHSQGGPTMTMLVALLENGSAEERAASGSGVNPLYQGGKPWVRSVSSVSGAHNGTTFGKLTGFNELAKQMLKLAASTVGASGIEALPYDFKLEQFGLKRNPDESQSQYWDRVWASAIWQGQDMALDSLSPEGSSRERSWVKTSPNVYYFSFSNGTTWRGWLSGNHYADLLTNPPLVPFANGMGAYRAYGDGWLQNDGVVNTISMKAPFGAPQVEWSGSAQKGRWHHMGYRQQDHWDVVGSGDLSTLLFYNWALVSFYQQQAERLKALD